MLAISGGNIIFGFNHCKLKLNRGTCLGPFLPKFAHVWEETPRLENVPGW